MSLWSLLTRQHRKQTTIDLLALHIRVSRLEQLLGHTEGAALQSFKETA